MFHDELVTAEIGQVGTQFDGPGHIGVRTSEGDLFYNGREREATYQRGPGNMVLGMGDLGVEFVAEKGFICRGVLLDATKHRGVNPLPIPKSTDSPGIITADDVKAMVQAAGIEEIGEGDCVFLYTGHGDLWKNSEWPIAVGRGEGRAQGRSSPVSRASGAAPASTSPSRRSS